MSRIDDYKKEHGIDQHELSWSDGEGNELLFAGVLFAALGMQKDTDGNRVFEVDVPMLGDDAVAGVLVRVLGMMGSQYFLTVSIVPGSAETNEAQV